MHIYITPKVHKILKLIALTENMSLNHLLTKWIMKQIKETSKEKRFNVEKSSMQKGGE